MFISFSIHSVNGIFETDKKYEIDFMNIIPLGNPSTKSLYTLPFSY